jgi:gamma-glutamylcyclotransferase (GGCT)/AIG2-like uncharacterized protein YtfP
VRGDSGSGSSAKSGHLFVYGTLRQGGSNDIARIAPEAVFVGNARVRGRLYDVNGRWPSLVLDDTAGWVTGEMYAVPAQSWPALDALEDPVTPERPDGAYFKVETDVACSDGSAARVTLYTANPAKTRLTDWIESGDWIAYVATRN